MAITIRNKMTEDRRIGRRTGEGPDAVVLRLVRAETSADRDGELAEGDPERRSAVFKALRRQSPDSGPKLN